MSDPPAVPPAASVASLVGPTTSGKTAVSLEVVRRARASGGREVELVSVDSMAVYRGMDIGTAKPSPEVRAEVPVHLVDLVDPSEEFTVRQFAEAARTALAGVAARGHGALLVGGTGLYLRAVVDGLTFPGRFPEVAAGLDRQVDEAGRSGETARRAALAELHARLSGLDPAAAARIEPGNRRRIVRALEVTIGSGRPFSSFGPGLAAYPPTAVAQFGLDLDMADVDRRIAARLAAQLAAGFVDEVRSLAARPAGLSRTARQALGYRELLSHVEAGVPLEEALAETARRTRAFARRQRAWFRRDPRIVWLGPGDDPVGEVGAALAAPVGD